MPFRGCRPWRASMVAAIMPICLCCSVCISQTRWFKYKGNPVFELGARGAWDDDWIHIDRVIKEGSGFRMWYTGGWDTARIGYASSPDGITWTRYGRNPVFNPRPESWESNVSRAYVTRDAGIYHMWYTGDNRTGFRLGYARSRNGIFWERFAGNPVLPAGPDGAWDDGFAALASVVGPDASGRFALWYQGRNHRIGFAEGKDPVSWMRHGEPVFWGNDAAFYPRVIRNGPGYELWCGTRDPARPAARNAYPQPGVFVFATSVDGVSWAERGAGPVFRPGPDGSWDDAGIVIGDVALDGRLYHMWYNGDDGTGRWRGGYAVSPRGMVITVSAANAFAGPGRDTVKIGVRGLELAGVSFAARIRIAAGQTNPAFPIEQLAMREVAVLDLCDDGRHGDSLAGDGFFANSWIPAEQAIHFVDLDLRLDPRPGVGQHVREFELRDAAVFSSIGPITLDPPSLTGGNAASPGDTLILKLTLRNPGVSAPARSVTATLIADDPSIVQILATAPEYGTIAAGGTSSTLGYYMIVVNPHASTGSDVAIRATISSWNIPFWYGSFSLRISPPWWRSPWALAACILIASATIGGGLRYAGVRRLRRRIHQLERDQAIERERARISRDMHDEIGATLTEIAILTEMAKRNPEDTPGKLQEISDRSAEVIASLGEIVWAMNPKNDTLDSFVAYLRSHTSRYLEAAGIRCRFDIPAEPPPQRISSERRRTMYLVVKEGLHNVVKHSRATEASLAVAFRDNVLAVVIADNGQGFDVGDRSGIGNGLVNMRKRMADIDGCCIVHSVPAEGTRITFSVPLTL